MKSKFIPLLLLVLLTTLLLPVAHAEASDFSDFSDEDSMEEPASEPVEVQVGIYILNLGKFDISSGTFTADFYLSMTCVDENNCDFGNFEFMNGRASTVDKIIDEDTEKFYRIQANLFSPVDLKQFPFDKEQMKIVLEDKEKTTAELRYVPLKDESGIDPRVSFIGWNLDSWDVTETLHEYPLYDETYSQLEFRMDISRIPLNSFLKTILPIIFIVLVLMSSFIIDPDKITNRLTMAGSSLVAAVMFHVSINNQIPPVGYLTFADKFMILTYFVILASFIMNIILLELTERKKTELVEKIHRATEFTVILLVPVLYIILFFILY